MTSTSERPDELARVAAPDEGISVDELKLAARNHGMPLEALRYDLTPPGLHYLLVHYDIPYVDPASWRLSIGGEVERRIELDLDALRARPRVTHTVTLECAGNGRARFLPRPISQPWLDEAVGTAEWTGTPLAPILAEAGIAPDAVDVVFTGHDHGTERGVEQDYARALSVADATADDVLLVYEMNGAPLPPQHGAPVRLIAPGWYGMAHVKWLRDIEVVRKQFTGFQNTTAYRLKQDADEPGEPVTPHPAQGAGGAAGLSRLPDPQAHRGDGRRAAVRARLVRHRNRGAGRGQHRRRRELARGRTRAATWPIRLAFLAPYVAG